MAGQGPWKIVLDMLDNLAKLPTGETALGDLAGQGGRRSEGFGVAIS